eukprot:TRINITY_DN92771_c0_g1_i1.p1 TRINITY_DN92771_c0_g1~~TRINITY_DN92771_c0_g1_i1.p1  ORF type:complete len:302 (-),score=41.79 TRINITY_DN92771_c0_g1_i1:55-960(-)
MPFKGQSSAPQRLPFLLAALALAGVACLLLPSSYVFVGVCKAQPRTRAVGIERREAPMVVINDIRGLPKQMRSKQMMGASFWDSVERTGLQQVLDDNSGIVQVLNFLPGVLASHTLTRLEALSENEWRSESHKGSIVDEALQSIATMLVPERSKMVEYSDATYKGDAIRGASGLIESLVGDSVIRLQAARYQSSNHIKKHGDSGTTVASMFTQTPLGQHILPGTKMKRKFAVILYLTRDWKESYGGCLVDHGCERRARTIVPQFNSAIIFKVPRDHEVTKMVEGSPSRYTVFGWFHEVGLA